MNSKPNDILVKDGKFVNRESKRAYVKKMKTCPENAINCPKCKIKTRHIAVRPEGSEADIAAVVCEVCRHILTYIPRHETGTLVKKSELDKVPKEALLK